MLRVGLLGGSGAGHELSNQGGERQRLITLNRVSSAGYDLDPHGRQARGRAGEVLRSDEGTVTAAHEHGGHAEPRQVVPQSPVAPLG